MKKLKQKRMISLNLDEAHNFMINLSKIGYFKISQKNHNLKKEILLKRFNVIFVKN